MVLIALLITGAFFASGQELAIARAELRDQQALAFAEYAAAHAIEGWDASARESMTVGQTATVQSAADGPLQSTVLVTMLDSALFLVVAEGRVATADAYSLRRRVGIVVRTIRDGVKITPPVRVAEQAWNELYGNVGKAVTSPPDGTC